MRIELMTLCMALCCLCLNAFAQNVPDYVPTEGLVGWYPFNGNANDESGNGNDGEINGATLSEDEYGNTNSAYYFDGNDRIDIAHHSDFDWSAMTFLIVYKDYDNPNAVPNGNSTLVTKQPGSGWGSGWGFSTGDENTEFGLCMTTTSGNECLGWGENEWGDWNMVAYTHSSDSVKVYFDGSLVSEEVAFGGFIANSLPITIGMRGNGWHQFIGSISLIGMWNHALTAEEITALYNAPMLSVGCADPTACNFTSEATSDDGSCIPSGCMETDACNYNALAECDGEACDYTCCPGPGCCSAGMFWNSGLEQCLVIEDASNEEGIVGGDDLVYIPASAADFLRGQVVGNRVFMELDCAQLLDSVAILNAALANTNADIEPDPGSNEFTCGDPYNYDDYDYATVQIGDQCWFAENLRNEHYANGDAIPGELSDSEWSSTTEGAQAVYNNDESNLADYGRLYNWYAVVDVRGFCPSDWHVGTDAEFTTLTDGLGGTSLAGEDMKSSPEDSPSWNGTNSSGFSGLAGGNRDLYGYFNVEGDNGYLWSASAHETSSWYRRLYDRSTAVGRFNEHLRYGFSVRLRSGLNALSRGLLDPLIRPFLKPI